MTLVNLFPQDQPREETAPRRVRAVFRRFPYRLPARTDPGDRPL